MRITNIYMSNPLEQLNQLELKANFTPLERQYFYKLRDELEAIVGGVSIEKLDKPTDVAQARRICAKLEEILKFVQDREMENKIWDEADCSAWLREHELEGEAFEFRDGGLIFRGNLDLSGRDIKCLPDNLHVMGGLKLDGCRSLQYLPCNLRIDETLYSNDCTLLRAVPDDLQVGKSLYLKNCTGLTSLPNSFRVPGDLYLKGCTALVHLPEELSVKGLNVQDCTALINLPDNLPTIIYLNISGCIALLSVPDSLRVDGNVTVRGCSEKIILKIKELKKRGQILAGVIT